LRALTYFDDPGLRTLSQGERSTLAQQSAAVTTLPQVSVLSRRLSGVDPENGGFIGSLRGSVMEARALTDPTGENWEAEMT
jgi:hypothetical protein